MTLEKKFKNLGSFAKQKVSYPVINKALFAMFFHRVQYRL